jgi:hypothetical protein
MVEVRGNARGWIAGFSVCTGLGEWPFSPAAFTTFRFSTSIPLKSSARTQKAENKEGSRLQHKPSTWAATVLRTLALEALVAPPPTALGFHHISIFFEAGHVIVFHWGDFSAGLQPIQPAGLWLRRFCYVVALRRGAIGSLLAEIPLDMRSHHPHRATMRTETFKIVTTFLPFHILITLRPRGPCAAAFPTGPTRQYSSLASILWESSRLW